MKWYHQLHWKFFLSHVVVVVVALVALLMAANMMTGISLLNNVSFPLWSESTETVVTTQCHIAIQEVLIVAVCASLVASVLMSLFLSRAIVEPLDAISTVSRRLTQGFYRERVAITSDGELAELSKSINRLAEALEQTEQQRRALLADVTHELRTPLSTIEGYMEGLLDGIVAPNEQTFNLILRESVRMQRLIEDLELLSRAEAGQIRIVPRAIDLRLRIEHLIMQFQPQFMANQVKLIPIFSDAILVVWADPERIDQVIINLLNNALRYTPAGGRVMINAWIDDEFVYVAIRDTGIGIEPHHLPHIFKRFYRVDKSRSRHSGGSGIGLTIARHLIYAHGGDMYATSGGAGNGTTFYFTLSRASAFAVDLEAPAGGELTTLSHNSTT